MHESNELSNQFVSFVKYTFPLSLDISWPTLVIENTSYVGQENFLMNSFSWENNVKGSTLYE